MPCLSRYNQAVTLIAPRYLALLRGGAFLFRKANAASGSRISHRASIGLALGVLSIVSPPSVAHNYPPNHAPGGFTTAIYGRVRYGCRSSRPQPPTWGFQ